MGGIFSSEKKTTSTTNQYDQSQEVNQQISEGLGVGITGSGNAVTLTDAGAIQRTADVAEGLTKSSEAISRQAFDFGGKLSGRAFDFAEKTLSESRNQSNDFMAAALNASQPAEALTKSIGQYMMYGIAALALALVFMKR